MMTLLTLAATYAPALQALVNTAIGISGFLIGFAALLLTFHQARRTDRRVTETDRRSSERARIEADLRSQQIQAAGIDEIQTALNQIDFHMRSTRHALHDLAVEVARLLDDGHRLDEIVHRTQEPLPEPYRLPSPVLPPQP